MALKAFITGHGSVILRLILIAMSLLFVPAAAYGFMSLWVIGFAAALVWFFDVRIREILEKSEKVENKSDRCSVLLQCYLVLMAEMSLIAPIGPAVFAFGGFWEAVNAGPWEAAFMNYMPLSYLTDSSFTQDGPNFQILNVTTVPAFLAFIGMLLLSSKKMTRFANGFLYAKTTKEKDGKIEASQPTFTFYTRLSGFTIWGIFFPSLFYALFLQAAIRMSGINDLQLLVYSVSGQVLTVAILLLCYLTIVATIKS